MRRRNISKCKLLVGKMQHFRPSCNKINFQTEIVCLYSFHWFYYEELLRKSIATAFKLHVDLITYTHIFTIRRAILDRNIFLSTRPAWLSHNHRILLICSFRWFTSLFFSSFPFVSLPFNILANLFSQVDLIKFRKYLLLRKIFQFDV